MKRLSRVRGSQSPNLEQKNSNMLDICGFYCGFYAIYYMLNMVDQQEWMETKFRTFTNTKSIKICIYCGESEFILLHDN